MTPYFAQDGVTLYHGDCREILQGLPDESVSAVVTDPPYGLAFMGKRWDYDVPAVEVWAECLRVLKPGGHLLAFAGTRTQHRMAVRIEDAGFEIRDMIAWVYGSGFPKSLDVSKAIDRMDASEEQERRRLRFTAWVRSKGVTARQIDEATGTNMGGHYTTLASQPAIMTREHLETCRHLFGEVPEWVEHEADIRSVESENMKSREVLESRTQRLSDASTWAQHATTGMFSAGDRKYNITAPATPEAKQWQGWGTALKPSQETITWARKPLTVDGERDTIAANLIRLEAKLWLLWNVLRADASSASSQSEYGEALSIAQWNAGNVTSTQGVLCEEMGTSQYAWALSTCWNIVQSWRRRWAGVWSHGNTSIISTVASQIIDLKTLSCCLLQITPENMLRAVSQAGGLKSTADTVVRFAYDYFAYCEGILTLSATENAIAKDVEQFQGEAVKPNLSPIVMARKPLIGTVAENVLQHGTGAINVDGCRVEAEDGRPLIISHGDGFGSGERVTAYGNGLSGSRHGGTTTLGRWPANLIHDGSDEVTGLFPADDDGEKSAARFFYTAKADKSDRGPGNNHPTVKPLDLMRYLVRLVCPLGGVVLDPFSGSGTTLAAAQAEGCLAIGVEREAAYCEIIKGRFHQRRLF